MPEFSQVLKLLAERGLEQGGGKIAGLTFKRLVVAGRHGESCFVSLRANRTVVVFSMYQLGNVKIPS